MSTALLGLSRYILAILMAFYTFHCFMPFAYRSEKERGGFYLFQILFLMLIHVIGITVLYLRSVDPHSIYYGAFQCVLFIGTILLYRIIYPSSSPMIVNNMCLFLSVGFIILTRLSEGKSLRQFLIAAVSVALTMVVPYLVSDLRLLSKFTWVYGFAGLGALSVVLVLGAVTYGSRISYSVAGITFQPSEFVKIVFVLFLAGILTDVSRKRAAGADWLIYFAGAMALGLMHVVVLALSRDLGGALIFFVIQVFMVYAALDNPLVLGAGAGGLAGGTVLGYLLFSHVRTRFLAWRAPFAYIDGQGYQITQSLFAIGTGGWFGMGLCMGSPDKIPVVEQDFIFSAVSEELGCIFSICLIFVCLSTFLLFMNLAMSMRQLYYRLIALGIAINYVFQVFLTIGGVTKFIPLTGVTLPLVSYGGSSVLATLIMFSVIQGIYLIRAEGDEVQQRVTNKKTRAVVRNA